MAREHVSGGADDDSLGTLVPLAAWQAKAEILDARYLDIGRLAPDRYQVRVRIYNRVDGARFSAWQPDDARYADGEIPVGSFTLP